MRDSITLAHRDVRELNSPVGKDHAYPDYLTIEVFGNTHGGLDMQLLSKNGSAYHSWRISPEMALALRDFIDKHTGIIEHRIVTGRTAYFK